MLNSTLSKLKSKLSGTTSIANKAIEEVTQELNVKLESEASNNLQLQTKNAVKVATSVARNLVDLNRDGKVDKEDLRYAVEKAGFVWDRIDSDLKEALLVGGVAGMAVNTIPLLGQFAAVPTFAGATAVFFVKAKMSAISVRKIIREEKKKDIVDED